MEVAAPSIPPSTHSEQALSPTLVDVAVEAALKALQHGLTSVKKHANYTTRWQLYNGILNSVPVEHRAAVEDMLIKFRCTNADKPITERQARAEIRAELKRGNCNTNINRVSRIIVELGGTIDRKALEHLAQSAPQPVTYKKLTPEERYDKALDDVCEDSTRACDFMNGKNPGQQSNRYTELSTMRQWSKPLSEDPYILKKRLDVSELEPGYVFSDGQRLIVPMTNALYPDWNSGWQIITPERKVFLVGQPTKGQYCLIGPRGDWGTIIVCEGIATGLSIYLATGLPVACALSLHNILPVAASLLHDEFDKAMAGRVLICADTGHAKEMKEAVQALRSRWHKANWCEPPADGDNVDFNDYGASHGLEEVNDGIQAAIANLDAPLAPNGKAGFFSSARDLVRNSTPPKMIIRGLIPERSLNSVTGPTGAGKSFTTADIGICTATGLPFHGRKVRQANVLYIAGEGGFGLRARFKALQLEYNLPEVPENLHVTSGPVDLLNADEVDMVASFIIEHEIELVIIDTFARCFAADENSAKDIGAAIQAITQKFIGAGAAVLLVHHTGHGNQDRARGSSAFRAALDVEIGVEKAEGGLRLKCWKTKDFEPWPEESYRMKSIDTGFTDEDGQPVTSLVLEPGSTGKVGALSSRERAIWEAACRLGPIFSLEDIRQAAYPLLTVQNKRQAVTRLLGKLEDQGLISFNGLAYQRA
jgi:hypothetical protein